MDDRQIVELYWQRDEAAIEATQSRYGARLLTVARHVLDDFGESEEAVNDTYMKAWEAMPPHRPERLCAFLCKITRQVSIDRYRRRGADKRIPSQYALSLDELAECVSGSGRPEDSVDVQELAKTIRVYLARLAPPARQAFVCRYFFADSLQDIAARQNTTVAKVKSMLYRTRQGLREHLQKEGFDV